MEDFSIDNFTLYDYSDNYIDFYDSSYDYINFSNNSPSIQFVAICIIICIALPLTLVAIYALYRLVRNDHVAPIYIISLLISNLIHLCCLIVEVARPEILTRYFIHLFSLFPHVCFMVCIALERYLVIACPLCYSSRRNIKNSVVFCVVVWALALVFVLILHFRVNTHSRGTIFGVFFLLPFPLFVFFLGGTLKALSASPVPSDEKRRIVGILVLVLFIYSLLFLPLIIYLLAVEARNNDTLWILSEMFFKLTPLADLTLYVFMKKGTIDRLLSSVCCCRMDSSDISSSPV